MAARVRCPQWESVRTLKGEQLQATPSTGKVQTVLGAVDPGQLGVTLTHEHLLVDLAWFWPPGDRATDRAFHRAEVSMETLGRIRHYSIPIADDARLMDIPTAIEELALYQQYGGRCVVEATSIGIARDPEGLARISRATGIHVIMGSSYYVDASHPAGMDRKAEEEITQEIVRDVTMGADGGEIRSGIIGEVGCTWPLTDNERKVLRASARAQRLTGASLLIHPGRDEAAPIEILEILAEAGADLARTIMGHLDRTVFARDTLKSIAETGCYLEWDLFGREESFYAPNPKVDMPSDARRMDDIAWIAGEGYGGRVVIAQDICHKNRLQRYGGHGYQYILANVVPRMRVRGFSNADIEAILVENPRQVLTFVAPG